MNTPFAILHENILRERELARLKEENRILRRLVDVAAHERRPVRFSRAGRCDGGIRSLTIKN